MHYENRQPPEGINVETKGWVKDFVLLVIGFFAGLVLLLWLLLQLVAWGARWTPFNWEESLTRNWQPEVSEQQVYLDTLARQLAEAGGLSPELRLRVHYQESKAVNAFATLGGNLVILSGLLDAVESEQGLAFVVAHEIAHIEHRHPVRSFARGLTLGMATALVFGQAEVAQLAGLGSNLALLDYSREQEAEADRWALAALQRHYGHVAGADELFRYLQKDTALAPEWLSSHPDLSVRIASLQTWAREAGYELSGPSTPKREFALDPGAPGP